jgi:hypothetical protein
MMNQMLPTALMLGGMLMMLSPFLPGHYHAVKNTLMVAMALRLAYPVTPTPHWAEQLLTKLH